MEELRRVYGVEVQIEATTSEEAVNWMQTHTDLTLVPRPSPREGEVQVEVRLVGYIHPNGIKPYGPLPAGCHLFKHENLDETRYWALPEGEVLKWIEFKAGAFDGQIKPGSRYWCDQDERWVSIEIEQSCWAKAWRNGNYREYNYMERYT